MCRFKSTTKLVKSLLSFVSIHPMCRFKTDDRDLQSYGKRVSIHPMCRFKLSDSHIIDFTNMFQYILCVGSST